MSKEVKSKIESPVVYNTANFTGLDGDRAKSPSGAKEGAQASKAAGRALAAQAAGDSSEEKSRGGVTMPPINAHRVAAAATAYLQRQPESRPPSRVEARARAVAQTPPPLTQTRMPSIETILKNISVVFEDIRIPFQQKCQTLNHYVFSASSEKNREILIEAGLKIAKDMGAEEGMRKLGLIRHLYGFIPPEKRADFIPKIMEITNTLSFWAQEQMLSLFIDTSTAADLDWLRSSVMEFVDKTLHKGSLRDQILARKLNAKLIKKQSILTPAESTLPKEEASVKGARAVTWEKMTKEQRLRAVPNYLKQIDVMFAQAMDSAKFAKRFSGLCGFIKNALSEEEKEAFAAKAYKIASREADNEKRASLLTQVAESYIICDANL